jgi:hypothetical protein
LQLLQALHPFTVFAGREDSAHELIGQTLLRASVSEGCAVYSLADRAARKIPLPAVRAARKIPCLLSRQGWAERPT